MIAYFKDFLRYYEWFILVYSSAYLFLYVLMGILAFIAIKAYNNNKYFFKDDIFVKSNHVTGVSIVAPAFNEALNIVHNVRSLMNLNYPKFEVVIVNDGSTDDTLQKLIEEFELVKVDFFYEGKIETKPVRGHYKSTNPVYSNLLVVDKENGKSKADASNAGINSAKYPLFICTDVDCILRNDTIMKLAKPFMESKTRVIATGGALRPSNSCTVKDGFLVDVQFPDNWWASFQELEYIRAFLFGRMAWGQINALLLVSGGLGMFDREIVIQVGGYWHKSLGEDMDLISRMRKYMHDQQEKFKILYIPETLCWTEVPSTKAVLMRQRVRWARGLIQTLILHRNMFFNPKYGLTGFVSMPYFFFFEFIVPILEVFGLLIIILSILLLGVSFMAIFKLVLAVYLFYLIITISSVLLDEMFNKYYRSRMDLVKLVFKGVIEPFTYHPFVVYAAIKGYWHYFANKEQKWGNMQRTGFQTKKK
ncbi:glycosyltransferase [Belliella kenyensis]|uniref:Glycosyltransferase n=1 Tax=Belliella kenyensis TaxID=1472724 RepID=A0ABV8EH95_9BACT|nr:glycosyltransferase [Belliella kenyensis]MCH7401196.1 glycosyltransferase [Belliella kenyensis]MDN3604193.1 glycosyltransferase [Belliella kenyensis]